MSKKWGPLHSFIAVVKPSAEAAAVISRACRDCHSNETVWPWYTQVAPVSWLMAYGVTMGRNAVNFSEWTAYSSEQQQTLLTQSCDDVTNGKMPGAYALLHPETRLSAGDVATVCAGARELAAHATRVSH